ncbi:MAG: MBOAT family O-acyltransferase [Chitinophagaceae bacterium]
MLFSTLTFFVFLPLAFVLYWFVFKKNLSIQNAFLLVASYVFYGWWSWQFIGLLVLSTVIDYSFGFLVASPNKKKARIFLWLSIINNLGILFLFKYFNFFSNEFKELMQCFGWNVNPLVLKWALPVGISFYTFHGMSYVFDIYRGLQKPVKSFVDYAVFVSFFPLLVAGPIERANHLLPQVQKQRLFSYRQALEGCRLILWGLFKKIIIADTLAPIVDGLFEHPEKESAYALFLGMIGFSIQIYGDFSGYSDMALGIAKLFGFELLSNFRVPYLSRNIAEFWRRWHISLSSWFRDYLYIPLGGSRNGKWMAVRNTMIIFLVSGFWHGASWNFLIWGGLHGLAFLPLLLLNRTKQLGNSVVAQYQSLPSLTELAQVFFTFLFITGTWVFFRITEFSKAILFFNHLFSNALHHPMQFLHRPTAKQVTDLSLLLIPLFLVLSLIGDWHLRHDERTLRVPANALVRHSLYFILFTVCLVKLIITAVLATPTNFIYFQF